MQAGADGKAAVDELADDGDQQRRDSDNDHGQDGAAHDIAEPAGDAQGVAEGWRALGAQPLAHFAADLRFSERWHATFDIDALAGGPGRAIDAALKIAYDVNDRWTVTAGYRTVEGGADVDDVYNFAWFNAAVVSGIVRF